MSWRYVPLLPSNWDTTEQLVFPIAATLSDQCRTYYLAVRETIATWWKQTTNPEYLEYAANGRRFLSIVNFSGAFFGFFLDIKYGETGYPGSSKYKPSLFWADVITTILLFAFLVFVPRKHLTLDVFIAILGTLQEVVAQDLVSQVCSTFFWMLILCVVTGMHSISFACYTLMTLVYAGCCGDSSAVLCGIGIGAPGFILVTANELNTSNSFYQAKRDQLAKHNLLDHATDGFCEVHIATGIVTNASLKLQDTLPGDGELEGMRFQSLLQSSTDKELFQKILNDISTEKELQPILVAIQGIDQTEFDAKLIPYSSSVDHVSLCLQRQGEARSTREQQDESTQGEMPQCDLAVTLRTVAVDENIDSASLFDGGQTRSGGDVDWFSSLAYSHKSMVEKRDIETQTCKLNKACDVGTQTLGTQALPPGAPADGAQGRRASMKRRLRGLKRSKRLLSNFAETPQNTVNWLVDAALSQMNPRGAGCCKRHIVQCALQQHILGMMTRACDPKWSPNCGWQCKHCFALHEDQSDADELLTCSVCMLDNVESCIEHCEDVGSASAADVESSPSLSCHGESEGSHYD